MPGCWKHFSPITGLKFGTKKNHKNAELVTQMFTGPDLLIYYQNQNDITKLPDAAYQ